MKKNMMLSMVGAGLLLVGFSQVMAITEKQKRGFSRAIERYNEYWANTIIGALELSTDEEDRALAQSYKRQFAMVLDNLAQETGVPKNILKFILEANLEHIATLANKAAQTAYIAELKDGDMSKIVANIEKLGLSASVTSQAKNALFVLNNALKEVLIQQVETKP